MTTSTLVVVLIFALLVSADKVMGLACIIIFLLFAFTKNEEEWKAKEAEWQKKEQTSPCEKEVKHEQEQPAIILNYPSDR